MGKTAEFLYRYSTQNNGLDDELVVNTLDSPFEIDWLYITINKFKIISRTSCGAWINVDGKKKFVNLERKKQFASETKERAKGCFIARKSRQVEILTWQLDQAKKELEYITRVE